MLIRKHFAKATIKSWKNVPHTNLGSLVATGAITSMVGFIASIPLASVIDHDDGNENQVEIATQYKQVLNQLTTVKNNYTAKYQEPIESTNTDIAYITKSLKSIADQTGDKATSKSKEDAKKAWGELTAFAKVFANDIQKDPNIAEADAKQIIEQFEDNVMAFKDLGYDGTPDAYDLRECQVKYNDSNKINTCTTSEENITDERFFKIMGYTDLVIFSLLAGIPLLLNVSVPRNRKRLDKWAEGKKAPKNPDMPH